MVQTSCDVLILLEVVPCGVLALLFAASSMLAMWCMRFVMSESCGT